MAHLNSGGMGPMLYISRVWADGPRAVVFETFYPPKRLGGRDVERQLRGARRSWLLHLVQRDGAWTVAERVAAASPVGP